jgi:hypothetical protein
MQIDQTVLSRQQPLRDNQEDDLGMEICEIG